MPYAGATHMYATFVSEILIARGDFASDWWEMVQPRVLKHRDVIGTTPEDLADMFSDEWRVIRETGGWKGRRDPEIKPEMSKAMRDTLRFCAVARRHGFA